jgi:hypothetical protein
MSNRLSPEELPPGFQKGDFVPLDPIHFRNAYATYMQALVGMLPPDADFPTHIQDAKTGEATPMPDTPENRAMYAAAKRFEDPAQRVSFLFRLFNVMVPIAALDRKYAKYRNEEEGTMHMALIAAVAGMPCNGRLTKKVLRSRFDAAFRRALTAVETWDAWEEWKPDSSTSKH